MALKLSTKFIIGLSIATILFAVGLVYLLTHPRIEYESVYITNTVYEIKRISYTNPTMVVFNTTNFVSLTNIYTDYSNYVVTPIILWRSNEYVLATHYKSFGTFYDPPQRVSNEVNNFRNELSFFYTINFEGKQGGVVSYNRELFEMGKVSLGVNGLAGYTIDSSPFIGIGINGRF